jgi:outer membrane protein assembly factor BamD
MGRITKSVALLGLFGLIFFSSCKSSFEKVRTSGDSELIYKESVKLYEEGQYIKAQSLMELIISAFRGRPELEDLYFKYSNTYFLTKDYVMAAYYFENFSSTFSGSELREEADYLTAFSHYKMSPSFRLEQSNTLKAIETFQAFVNRFPDSDRVEECNQLIDECRRKLEMKAFDSAMLYFDLQQYQSALKSLENILIEFPDTKNLEEVRFKMVEANYLLATNSIYEKKEERYNETIKYALMFLDKYQEGSYFNTVQTFKADSETQLKLLSND